MGVIETEEAAKRLARVIVSDIEIYNKDKFHTGADLTAAIEEGRALFRSRVAEPLHRVYEDELLPWQGTAKDHAIKVAPARVDRTRVLIAIGAVAAFVAVVAWLVLRR